MGGAERRGHLVAGNRERLLELLLAGQLLRRRVQRLCQDHAARRQPRVHVGHRQRLRQHDRLGLLFPVLRLPLAHRDVERVVARRAAPARGRFRTHHRWSSGSSRSGSRRRQTARSTSTPFGLAPAWRAARRGGGIGFAYRAHVHRDRKRAELSAADLQDVRDVDVLARLQEVVLELELDVGRGRLFAGGTASTSSFSATYSCRSSLLSFLCCCCSAAPVSCLARMRGPKRRLRGPGRRRRQKRDGNSSRKSPVNSK